MENDIKTFEEFSHKHYMLFMKTVRNAEKKKYVRAAWTGARTVVGVARFSMSMPNLRLSAKYLKELVLPRLDGESTMQQLVGAALRGLQQTEKELGRSMME